MPTQVCEVTLSTWRWKVERSIEVLENFGRKARMKTTTVRLRRGLLRADARVRYERPHTVWDEPWWLALYLLLRAALKTGEFGINAVLCIDENGKEVLS